jgi:hypothetical protein
MPAGDQVTMPRWVPTGIHMHHDIIKQYQGRIQGGGAPGARPPLKLEKIWFFGVKSWFFTRNTQKYFAPPSARRNFFKCAPPNLKSWIRPCLLIMLVPVLSIQYYYFIIFFTCCFFLNAALCWSIIFFPILGGGARRVRPLPVSAPGKSSTV